MELLVCLIIGFVVIMLVAAPKETLGFIFLIWMIAALGRLVVHIAAFLGA